VLPAHSCLIPLLGQSYLSLVVGSSFATRSFASPSRLSKVHLLDGCILLAHRILELNQNFLLESLHVSHTSSL
jgi:hypothetical protein